MIEPHQLKIGLVAAVVGLSLVAAVHAYNKAETAELVVQQTNELVKLIQKQNQVIKTQIQIIEEQQIEIELAGECK